MSGMSRTDVHRPWEVQRDDPYNRQRLYRWGIELVPVYRICGCEMCTGRYWYRGERRRQRYAARREIMRQLLEYEATRGELPYSPRVYSVFLGGI